MLLCRRCKIQASVGSYFSDFGKKHVVEQQEKICGSIRTANQLPRPALLIQVHNNTTEPVHPRRHLRSTFWDPTQRDPYSCGPGTRPSRSDVATLGHSARLLSSFCNRRTGAPSILFPYCRVHLAPGNLYTPAHHFPATTYLFPHFW